ncbi:hypothetical protein FBU30_003654 [Linnemannia zychae]|nr:hypothetical protein FBU30_003654 [Linnemannia zychae]
MAKKRASTRKTRQAAHSSNSDHHPYRHNKHISASPSVASSPSPQPHDLVQRRRKGTPVRSPSQGDPSKGIVFAFRIQPNSDLSMAVDILSYDQVFEPESTDSSTKVATSSTSSTTLLAAMTEQASTAPSIASSALTDITTMGSIPNSEIRDASSNKLKLGRENWSSDPSSYLSNNVVDLTRNVLILHSRKPQDPSTVTSAAAAQTSHPYSRSAVPSRSSSMSLPSTPPLTDSSPYSSASSSPSSSPSSPVLQPMPLLESSKENSSFPEQLSSALPLSLPLPDPMVTDLKSQPPRMLRVRGLGNGSRRMQVFVV